MSPELKRFYQETQNWITTGCDPDHPVFSIRAGLCENLERWCEAYNLEIRPVYAEQLQLFLAVHKTAMFPFGQRDFTSTDDTLFYKNPVRLAWIREHAQ